MKNYIHPTAVIDVNAKMGGNNFIGPFCIIGPNVVMGSNNRLESHVVVGTPAQHRDYFIKDPGPVVIGDNNVFREFVTVNGGTTGVTTIGHKNSLLIGSHVGHDAVLKDSCNLGNNVVLGGHSIIGVGANLGLSTVVHQYRIVGAYSMIGMNSTVIRDIVPFTISMGSPCEIHRINRIGLQRAGVATTELVLFEDWFLLLRGKSDFLPKLSHAFHTYVDDFEKDRQAWSAHQTAA